MPADPIRLTLPLNLEEAKELRAGQACLLSGPLFTLRDACLLYTSDAADE